MEIHVPALINAAKNLGVAFSGELLEVADELACAAALKPLERRRFLATLRSPGSRETPCASKSDPPGDDEVDDPMGHGPHSFG